MKQQLEQAQIHATRAKARVSTASRVVDTLRTKLDGANKELAQSDARATGRFDVYLDHALKQADERSQELKSLLTLSAAQHDKQMEVCRAAIASQKTLVDKVWADHEMKYAQLQAELQNFLQKVDEKEAAFKSLQHEHNELHRKMNAVNETFSSQLQDSAARRQREMQALTGTQNEHIEVSVSNT